MQPQGYFWTKQTSVQAIHYELKASNRPFATGGGSLGVPEVVSLEMKSIASRFTYSVLSVIIPVTIWGAIYGFNKHYQIEEPQGMLYLRWIQCFSAILTLAGCIGLRGRPSVTTTLPFLHLALSLLLISGALLTELVMFQPLDRR